MRVLILSPVGRDAALIAQTLAEGGVETATARDFDGLLELMGEGLGAVMVADEALNAATLRCVEHWLKEQPEWSDPPFVVLTMQGRPSQHTVQRALQFAALGNFTLVERPARPETVLSAARAALRARMRQYEIRSRQEALLRANADLEQFAYSASHDLKEPLRNISIFSELLLLHYAKALDGRGAGFLQLVRESSTRMEQLLGELLAFVQAASIPAELPEPTPVAKPLEAALANLDSSIRETEARITVGDLPAVRMREIHLTQLFQNLIGNAIKYRRDGVTPEIRVSSEPMGDRWLFRVADNGIGVSEEYRESIFGIFKRLHTNDGKYAGTGMGLAICQRIVERYQGRIWVESEPGDGSEFIFTVPA